jgi:hypothetical protein
VTGPGDSDVFLAADRWFLTAANHPGANSSEQMGHLIKFLISCPFTKTTNQ